MKPTKKWGSIERWTVERLDWDAGMARIEIVPMQPRHLTDALMKKLSQKGLETGIDSLSLWDLERARVKRMTLRNLKRTIGVRSSEIKKLDENMVFWALYSEGDKKAQRILHATRAARQVSKDLYKMVTRNEGGRS